MLVSNKNLKNIQSQVNSKDDLRKLADLHGILYTESDLDKVYGSLNNNLELDLDSLSEVSGGKIETIINLKKRKEAGKGC